MRRINADGVAVAICLGIFLAFIAFSATHPRKWMEVDKVGVHDAPSWQDVRFDVDREIHRNFDGGYRCDLSRKTEAGESHTVLFADWVYGPYRTGGSLPAVITSEWWCKGSLPDDLTLEPGDYELCTKWVINPNWPIWTRFISMCDPFAITP